MKVTMVYVSVFLMAITGIGLGFNYATAPAAESTIEEPERPEYLDRIDTAELHLVHKFENISGSAVGFRIVPEDGTHMRVTFALVSEGSYLNVGDLNYTGYNKTNWIPIDEPIIIEVAGGDSFPDDDRCDYIVVHTLPHPPEGVMNV